MNKQQIIETITNGSTDTRELVSDLIHQLYEDNLIFDYNDEGLDGILVKIEFSVSKPMITLNIDWETKETTNGVDDLYFYEIS
jgi:hypothetical protein